VNPSYEVQIATSLLQVLLVLYSLWLSGVIYALRNSNTPETPFLPNRPMFREVGLTRLFTSIVGIVLYLLLSLVSVVLGDYTSFVLDMALLTVVSMTFILHLLLLWTARDADQQQEEPLPDFYWISYAIVLLLIGSGAAGTLLPR
jgi:uncharacterized membrane protein